VGWPITRILAQSGVVALWDIPVQVKGSGTDHGRVTDPAESARCVGAN